MSLAKKLEPSNSESDQVTDSTINPRANRLVWFAVLVAGLGYFVDVFDLWLFSNLRVSSLTSMGLSPEQVTEMGAKIINSQQGGLLLGGFFWGILGDKRGRSSVMFGSIALYSTANFLNGFVTSIDQYIVLRFVAGLGLAGEIGTGITLISELMPKARRGLGTTVVATLGVSGACFAALASKALDWRYAYMLGGVMGFGLLGLRVFVVESGMFRGMQRSGRAVQCGSLKLLFGNLDRTARFCSCVFVGIPLYLTFGLFVTFSPEIAKATGIVEPVSVADILFVGALAMTLGDLLAGLASQALKSRKLPMRVMLLVSCLLTFGLSLGMAKTPTQYMLLVGFAGLCSGYWACLITTTAEQFGTNLRATVATSLPNLVRASIIPLTMSFIALKASVSVVGALLIITSTVYLLAFVGLWYIRESFDRDLNFYEI